MFFLLLISASSGTKEHNFVFLTIDSNSCLLINGRKKKVCMYALHCYFRV